MNDLPREGADADGESPDTTPESDRSHGGLPPAADRPPDPSHGGAPPASDRPPALADALLHRVIPKGTAGLSIIGDLHEEYHEILRSRGPLRARLWYWRSALAIAGAYARLRLAPPFTKSTTREGRRPTAMAPRRVSAPSRFPLPATLGADFHFGLRMLKKTPLLSLAAVLTIGLGVGLTTQTFSAVYGSILRGLPVPGQERLMVLDENRLELDIQSMDFSIHDYLDLRRRQTSFEDVAAFYQGTANLAVDNGLPERYAGAYLSANALGLLGVPPLLGRVFRPGEDEPEAPSRAVIGYHLWRNRFGADPRIVGRTVRVNGETTEIVGVMPEGFRFPFNEDIWLTHRLDAATLPRGTGQAVTVFGRLRQGVSQDAAAAELAAIARGLAERFPDTNQGVGMGLQRYELRFMPKQIRTVLWLMLLSTFGVLLIGCANVANLLLGRATLRTKEVAIRTAMGAGRLRVVRQLLAEAAVLAVIGGALGLFLSLWGMRIYNDFAAGINRPFWIDPRVDGPMLLFSLGATTVATLAAGIVPAFRASGVRVGEVLKDQGRGSSSLRMGRFSTALVIGEVALSASILVGAGFMIESVLNASRVDLGFDPSHVMTGKITLFEPDYPDPQDRDQFLTSLKERIEAEPQVLSAALATHLPGLGSFTYHVAVEGTAYAGDRDYPAVAATAVSADYFRTFGVEPVQGRDFTPQEARYGGDPVVIVNRSFADRYLDGAVALGRRIRLERSGPDDPWLRIVGVVPDMHVGGGVGGLGDDRRRPERIYLPRGLDDGLGVALAVRTEGPPEALAPRLRAIVTELDPDLPIYDLVPEERALDQATWAFRLFGVQFSVFGGLALFLAAVGLYGVMAFSVNQRRQEMGVRMALGAPRTSILGLVLRRATRQLGIGIAVGLLLGAGLGRPMSYVLYGVDPTDIRIYLTIAGTLGAVGLFASLFPARAAARVDPVRAMHVEG